MSDNPVPAQAGIVEPMLLPLRDRLLGLASKHAAKDWPELQAALQEAADEIGRLRAVLQEIADYVPTEWPGMRAWRALQHDR